jgi:uncharacterized membrane protein YsdA (DUF1294 family)
MTGSRPTKSVSWQSSVLTALVLQGLVAASMWFFLKVQLWLAWLVAASLMTFLTYGIDKFAAGRGWRRTPEWAIWIMILTGGVVGGWFGQLVFRHKTRKWTFWVVLFLATVLYSALLWVFRELLGVRRGEFHPLI